WWALHPSQTEAVAWASGRYDLLGVPAMLGILLLQDRDAWPAWLAQAALLFVACLSKETFLPVVVVVAVDDFARRRPRWGRYAAFAVAIAAWYALRRLAVPGGIPISIAAVAVDIPSTMFTYIVRAVAPRARPWAAGLLAAMAALGAVWTLRRVPDWKTDRSLFESAYVENQDDWMALLSLGVQLMNDGRLPQSRELLEHAYALRPTYE